MKRFCFWLVFLFLLFPVTFGCSTVQQNQEIVDSLAEKAGIICWQYLPEQQVVFDGICAVHEGLFSDADPALAQEQIKEFLGKIWVQAGDAEAWLVQTTLNDLVRYMELNTSDPTKEKLDLWLSVLGEFCRGVQLAKGSGELLSFFDESPPVYAFLRMDLK